MAGTIVLITLVAGALLLLLIIGVVRLLGRLTRPRVQVPDHTRHTPKAARRRTENSRLPGQGPASPAVVPAVSRYRTASGVRRTLGAASRPPTLTPSPASTREAG